MDTNTTINLPDVLAEVTAAEGRLAAGTYGRCERCGRPIVGERLLARPEVALVPIVLLFMALARHLPIDRLRTAPAKSGGRPVFLRLAEAWLKPQA